MASITLNPCVLPRGPSRGAIGGSSVFQAIAKPHHRVRRYCGSSHFARHVAVHRGDIDFGPPPLSVPVTSLPPVIVAFTGNFGIFGIAAGAGKAGGAARETWHRPKRSRCALALARLPASGLNASRAASMAFPAASTAARDGVADDLGGLRGSCPVEPQSESTRDCGSRSPETRSIRRLPLGWGRGAKRTGSA